MLQNILVQLFARDLDKLNAEIEAYTSEKQLWRTGGQIKNPAGNLCLHLLGNLNHYIGRLLGGVDYRRDRDAEFNLRNMPRQELLAQIDECRKTVLPIVQNLSEAQLAAGYPEQVFGQPMTSAWFLVHLATHFNYHLGQINYHRRLLGVSSTTL